jgi:hypothetical protein
MKLKSDLNGTRDREKQMWNAVNEKRDVRKSFFAFDFLHQFFNIEIETTTKRKSRTSSC